MKGNELKLGQKIKQFRQRAKISQFQLEIQIGASPGSLSRIESGEVNPTKETLVKIIEALDLRSYDAASLYNLDLEELPKMVEIAKKLNSSLDLDKVLQNAVNEVVYELNLLGSVIFIIEGETLFAKTLTQSWYTKLVLKILNMTILDLHISMNAKTDNLVVRCIKERKVFISNYLRDYTKDVFSDEIADLCANVANHKSAIVFPMIYEDNVIGALLFSKSYVDDFKKEYKILETFTEYIAVAVNNARKYKQLEDEVIQLKNERH